MNRYTALVWAAQMGIAAVVSAIAGRFGGHVGQALAIAGLAALATVIEPIRRRQAPPALVLVSGWATASIALGLGMVFIWLVPALWRRNARSGATLAAAASPLGVWLLLHPGPAVLALAAAGAAVAVWAQRDWWRQDAL